MREIIVQEWRDELDFLRLKEVKELVRCGDCVYTLGEQPQVIGFVYCQHHHKMMWEKAYCSYGERIDK